MENAWLALGVAVVLALALLRLRQMLRWVPCEATFLGIAKPLPWGMTYSGQALPISFRLPDGREVRATLRHFGRGGVPRPGERMRIRYHPDDPERVERAVAVPLLMLAIIVLLVILTVVLRRSLRDAALLN